MQNPLFVRRSISESSENLTRSPSLSSIREHSNSWSTHENEDDRKEKISRKSGEFLPQFSFIRDNQKFNFKLTISIK